jgi:probable HAF family extracellular repeat protein
MIRCGNVVLLFALTATVALAQYTFTDLGALPGSGVCGTAGFVQPPASDSSTCTAISKHAPVGYGHSPETPDRALVFGGGAFQGATLGAPYVLPLPAVAPGFAPASYAFAINDAGLVVGSWTPEKSIHHAIVWYPHDAAYTPEDLNSRAFPDWMLASATAVNKHGQIAGWGSYKGSTHAFLLTPGLGITDLGSLSPLPYDHSVATGINDRGEVVGYGAVLTAAGVRLHAWVWSRGVMTDLGVPPAFENSIATAINNHGKIVGYANTVPSTSTSYLNTPQGRGMALAYEPATGWKTLTTGDAGEQDAGPGLIAAFGINDHGQIAGLFVRQGQPAAGFLLTPSTVDRTLVR